MKRFLGVIFAALGLLASYYTYMAIGFALGSATVTYDTVFFVGLAMMLSIPLVFFLWAAYFFRPSRVFLIANTVFTVLAIGILAYSFSLA